MLRFLSFSSGSCGNCSFLTDGSRGILIDAGVSLRRVKRALNDNGFGFDDLRAVLLTHEHMDHIRHLGSFCKRLRLPVYATGVIHEAILGNTFTRDWVGGYRMDLPADGPCEILPGVVVRHFIVPHDASQTVGFSIDWDGHRFVFMTDMGRMTNEALEYARTANTVVIESNYDMRMLIGGKYPEDLKMRICQGSGHLSNDECAEAVAEFWHPGLRNIFLCHLSENNNTPLLAFDSTARALRHLPAGDGLTAKDVVNLQTLPRGVATRLFEL